MFQISFGINLENSNTCNYSMFCITTLKDLDLIGIIVSEYS
jgi:hypothetical protein